MSTNKKSKEEEIPTNTNSSFQPSTSTASPEPEIESTPKPSSSKLETEQSFPTPAPQPSTSQSSSSQSPTSKLSQKPKVIKNIKDYVAVVLPKGQMAAKLAAAAPYNFFLTVIDDSKPTHREPLSITLQGRKFYF